MTKINLTTLNRKLGMTLALLLLAAFATGETVNTARGAVTLHLPTDYSSEHAVPLVVLLHGYTSSGARQNDYMKFSALVDEYDFMLLLPDGTVEQAGDKNRFWNATPSCCNFQNSTVDDSTYLINLIKQVAGSYAVDANRVYLIGHSNGGFMSHRMAYDHPDTIAAIVSLAGASPLELSVAAPADAVSILQIHGTDDATIKYAGGEIRGHAYPGAEQTMALWAKYTTGSVNRSVDAEQLDLEAAIPGAETMVTYFDEPRNLTLWTIQQGGHVPTLSPAFSHKVIQWLYAHPQRTRDES